MSHEPFLRSIIENREDDTPRLVFADYLEENGEAARARFIRLQCEFKLLKECDSWPSRSACYCHWHTVRRELLHLSFDWKTCWRTPILDWFPYLTQLVGIWVVDRPKILGLLRSATAFIRRGFVSEFTGTFEEWREFQEWAYWCPREITCYRCGGWTVGECTLCHKTGKILLPFPESAQPLEKVTLLTWPDDDSVMTDGVLYPFPSPFPLQLPPQSLALRFPSLYAGAKSILEKRWPGLEFALPEDGGP